MNYTVHPGTVMKTILLSMGKKQKWLAEEMKMSKVVISELINQKRNVTPQIAISFENATGYPAQTLLRMQADYDLFNAIKKDMNVDIKVENVKEEDYFTHKTPRSLAV